MDRTALRPIERAIVGLLESVNGRPGVRRVVDGLVRAISARWVAACTRNLWEIHGWEHVRRLAAPRGLILVSNHRSFFDMYLCATVLVLRTRLVRRQFYPVRSRFFYDNPLGLLVNAAISGGAMWPPVFREPSRARLNRTGVLQMAHVLGPGAVVGIHPEGQRNKTDDPYRLLPPRQGTGRLVQRIDPDTVVLPFFILGMSSDVLHEIRRNFRPPGRRGEPIRIWFGEPLRAGELRAGRGAREISVYLMSRVAELAELDRSSAAS